MIEWPESKPDAIRVYLQFLVDTLTPLDLSFPLSEDPIQIARSFIGGQISQSEYDAELTRWWDYVLENDMLHDLVSSDAIRARLAICLLSANEDSNLDEHLSWFLEVLYALAPDIERRASLSLHWHPLARRSG